MKVTLITGATGKVGQVLVKHFLGSGHTVIGVSSSNSSLSLESMSETLAYLPGEFVPLSQNLLDENSAANLARRLIELNLYPEYLINNARSIHFLSLNDDGSVPRSHFLGELTLDVVVPYELTMALANDPCSRLRSVVNIGSQYGIVAPNLSLYANPLSDSPLHYGVAKAALTHLTKELAVRFAKKPVRVNCVAYGGIEGRVDDSFKHKYANLCPMGRMLTEDELAHPVEMLLSDASSAITGVSLLVDCGWSLW